MLNRKYYVDEIYDALIVRPHGLALPRRPLAAASTRAWWTARRSTARRTLSRGLGWIGSRLQTGQIGVYVVLFLVGAVWVLRAVIR